MNGIESGEFLIYDLETFNIRVGRTMPSQFAARRYSPSFRPLDDGMVFYCKLPEDCLPSLDACILTGITPQYTNRHGLCELEFARKARMVLLDKKTDTIVAGYNNTSFDNWVINHLLFRNLLPPYEPFTDRSLDCFTLVKAVHYLDKGVIKCLQVPRDDGTMRDSLKLEHLSKANGLLHTKAHDALSDVEATAALFSLIREKDMPAYLKYLSRARKANPAAFAEYCAKSEVPVMAVTRSVLSDSSFITLALVLASDANSFYALDLLCCENQFQENLTRLQKAQELPRNDYVRELFSFCHVIKVNEGPYLDYSEKYYENAQNAEDVKRLVEERLDAIKKIRKKAYFAINSFKSKNASGASDFKKERDPEESLPDGPLDRKAGYLMELAENGSPDDMRKALTSLGKSEIPHRAKILFSHMVARNYPELYSRNALLRWRDYVKNRLCEQRDGFIADYNRLKGAGLSVEKKQVANEVVEYAKELFDRFSLKLF